MLAERALEWTREWKEEGRQEGVQSLQQVVLSQLEQRFGTLSAEVRQSIEKLRDLDSLTRIATRILLVSSIDELGLG
ncbi:MAG TPA: DUF4351 domain-containing protein [Thermoanaerobaculia bacterium]|nr:DUF4351 domain-containing protein [Thermoanaerobaculia bacterium]